MEWIYFLVFLFLPTIENAVVSIDGSIDLGPYFQIEYSLAPLSYNYDIDKTKNVQVLSKSIRKPTHKGRHRKKKRQHKHLRDDENTTQTFPFDEKTVTPTTDLMTMLGEETTPSDITTMFTEIPETGATETEIPETEATETDIPETEATETEIPETEATETEIPETEETETGVPETKATETEIPETEIPETEATETDLPETEATVTEVPETETTETEIPETDATETEVPETAATETEIPETEATETEVPETEATETEISETESTETEIPETEATETEVPETEATSTSSSVRPKKITTQPEWISKWFTRRTRPRTTRLFDVTRYQAINRAIDSKIFDKNHKVKDVVIIKDFSVHILRQTLQVFEKIKNKIEDHKMKRKVDFLSRNYKNKFSDFVRETQNHNVRTRLGTQKVVLNTIDTSVRILKRLVNYFVGNINKNPTLSDEGIGNIVETEFRKEIELEYQHACKKFGICRNAAGFQQFLIDVINEILKNDDKKLRDANDALTEVLKETDLTKILDSELKKKVDKAILRLEIMEPRFLRPTYTMYRNAIGLRNKPLSVMVAAQGSAVNKTVAFLDIVDTLDLNIKPNEKNVMVWTQIKHHLSQWTAGMTKESYPIMEMFVKHIMDEINKFDLYTAVNINEKLSVIMMDDERMDYDYQ